VLARSPDTVSKSGVSTTVRLLPAISRIWRLTIRSDSTGRTPRGRVAVVDDDVRDAARVGDAREERHVALPAALEHEDPLLVGVDAERVEDERERELLRSPLDEDRAAREEELGAVAVELGERAERLGLRERLGLEERRPARRRVADERELLELVDAEKDRRVGRVEDLVSRLGEGAQEAVEVALRMRAEVELRLLDQEHEVAEMRGDELFQARDEREPAVRGGPVVVGRGRQQQLGDFGCAAACGGRNHRAGAEVRGQEEHRRRTGPVEVERVRRAGVEEDRPLRHVCFEPDASTRSVVGHVVDGGRRGGGLEQRPDRGQHG
jgi:hypothetical protein